MEFKVNFKEKLYLAFMILFSASTYIAIIPYFLNIFGYAIFGVYIYVFLILSALNIFGQIMFIGYLRGNTIKLNNSQFPEIYEILKKQSEKLNLKNIPTIYLMQGDGILQALATRFNRHNYIVIYSDVLAAAYKEGLPVVEFIIGHELGHIKRNHLGLLKSVLLLPARIMPFLGTAYSRACEYTCDNIAYNLCPEGAEKGLLILATGKDLLKQLNVKEFLRSADMDEGFVTWFAEIFSDHPHLVKRVAALDELKITETPIFSPFVVNNPNLDAYKPKQDQLN